MKMRNLAVELAEMKEKHNAIVLNYKIKSKEIKTRESKIK